MKQRSPTSCPVVFGLDLFGDKWSLVILRDILLDDKRHFSEFLASREKIASNILSTRLEMLVANGLLVKEDDPANKSAAIYRPTHKALGLLPMLFELIRWGAEYNTHFDYDNPILQDILADPEGTRVRLVEKFSE